jgi:hypothetical protein
VAIQLKSKPKHYADQVARELRTLKTAAGPSSDKGYEQVLAKLGMSIIQEQLPEAMEYFQGMSLLDRRDDGKFVAGFFTFNVGGAIVDIPVFLIDGRAKGYQVLFLRHSKLFLPAEAEVIDFILKQQKSRIGDASYNEGDRRDRHTAMNVKVYSDQNRFMTKQSALETLDSILKAAESAEIYTPGEKRASLPSPEWINMLNSKTARAYLRTLAHHSPRLERKIAAVLGDDWKAGLDSFEKELDSFMKTAAAPTLDLFGDSDLDLTGYTAPVLPKIAAFESAPEGLDPALAIPEIAKLGAFFHDTREAGEHKVAMAVVQDYVTYTSPLYTGKFDVVVADGSHKEMYVVRPTDIVQIAQNDVATLLFDPATKAVGLVAPSQVAARNLENQSKALDEEVKGLYDIDAAVSIANSGPSSIPCIIVFEEGKCTPPLYLGPEDESGSFSVSPMYINIQGQSKSLQHHPQYTQRTGVSIRIDRIAVDSTDTLTCYKIVRIDDGAILRVPKNSKMIKLAERETSPGVPICCDDATKQIRVLPLSDLDIEEMRKIASFTTRRLTDNHLELNGRTHLIKEAVFKLMHSGLSKQASIEIATSAKPLTQHFIITDPGVTPVQLAVNSKLAYSMRDPEYQFGHESSAAAGQEGYHIPIQSEQNVRETLRSTGVRWANTSAPPWSSEQTPYTQPNVREAPEKSEARQMAEDPGYIFDNQMFTAMVKHVNPAVERERLLTGLIKCCDSVGRAYFLLLAHGQEFAEAYGADDSEEMEEQLLTLLEAGGKQLVTLFNRSVSVGVDLGMTTGMDA